MPPFEDLRNPLLFHYTFNAMEEHGFYLQIWHESNYEIIEVKSKGLIRLDEEVDTSSSLRDSIFL